MSLKSKMIKNWEGKKIENGSEWIGGFHRIKYTDFSGIYLAKSELKWVRVMYRVWYKIVIISIYCVQMVPLERGWKIEWNRLKIEKGYSWE